MRVIVIFTDLKHQTSTFFSYSELSQIPVIKKIDQVIINERKNMDTCGKNENSCYSISSFFQQSQNFLIHNAVSMTQVLTISKAEKFQEIQSRFRAGLTKFDNFVTIYPPIS